jgi:hypothetical protein
LRRNVSAQKIGEFMDHEIDRFKSEINLIEYASDKGYQIDRAESSRNSVVMRSPATDDKIIVGRGPNGHWKYFSVRDSSDNGTIIDFAQKRDVKNLVTVHSAFEKPDKKIFFKPRTTCILR